MKLFSKILIYFVVIFILASILWVTWLWKIFNSGIAGSYPHAKIWTFNVKESDLLRIIKEIRKEHPELNKSDSDTSTITKDSYWHHIIFYYDDTHEKVQTWVRSETDSSSTSFALVAIAKEIDYSKAKDGFKIERKEINHDFNYFENKVQIKKFEDKIVSLIDEKINHSQH